ncbi:MAG: hypothetical protein Q8927_21125, partial [Bacteroidota bacterium]|nr:hypothetical protein [Bacteroidota bacterium]
STKTLLAGTFTARPFWGRDVDGSSGAEAAWVCWDSLNRSIIPNIGVIIENVADKMDVVTYSAKKRGSASFDVTAMFIAGDGKINFVNAVGYKGTYTDAFEHIVYVVHAINNKKGIQIILDTTTGTFDQIEPEFFEVLRSIRKSKEPPKPS